MNVSSDRRPLPTLFAGVIRMGKYYVAVSKNESEIVITSKQPVKDFKIAQITAQIFAEKNGLPINTFPMQIFPPPITVIMRGKKWVPAEIYQEHICFFPDTAEFKFSGNFNKAMRLGHLASVVKKVQFLPAFGITLSKTNIID